MALILSAYVLQDTVSSASPRGFTSGVFSLVFWEKKGIKVKKKKKKKTAYMVGKGEPEKDFSVYLSTCSAESLKQSDFSQLMILHLADCE